MPACSPETLDAAGKDADANAGAGQVGDSTATCSSSQPKAHIAVHVQTTAGDPVGGVVVSVDGHGWAGVTDANGNFDFGEVPPDTYTVTGEAPTANASQTLSAPAGATTQFILTAPRAHIAVHVQTPMGDPVKDVTVSVDGHGWAGVTDANGNFDFGEVPPDTYTVKGEKDNCIPNSQTLNAPVGAMTSFTLVMTPVTVTITLAQPVACPGHPLVITATGNPAGGTFAWTIAAPAADLVDAAGNSVRAGDTVNLRGFQGDPATGNIPTQTATISVTYTLASGQKATASQNVTIHEIKFAVTNNTINQSPTTVVESAAVLKVTFGAAATMSTDPQVEIQLDASCPRKADCASNHRVAWLQTVWTFVSDKRYTHTLSHKTPAMPVRDALPGAPFPFYDAPTVFTGDKDKETAHHEDSPGTSADWTDPRGAAPAPPPAKNRQLRQVVRTESFTAWLVVQNIEWAAHDLAGSFAFVGNFDWSMGITLAVDTSQAVGSRATPQTAAPTVPASITTGKGGNAPNLAAPVANTTTNDPAILHIDPAPELP